MLAACLDSYSLKTIKMAGLVESIARIAANGTRECKERHPLRFLEVELKGPPQVTLWQRLIV